MLSVGCKLLECADCKTSFTSAALLLKHFADHISDQAFEKEYISNNESANLIPSKKSKLSFLQGKKKERRERKESILETVLRQSVIHSKLNEMTAPITNIQNDVSHSNTSSDSFKSSSNQNSADGNCDASFEKAEKGSLPYNVVEEIGQRAEKKRKCLSDMSVMKFDLQKRLENCVSRLAVKQENKEIESCNAKEMRQSCGKTKYALPANKDILKETHSKDCSPLSYNDVTFQECSPWKVKEEQNNPATLKNSSNRKQLMPKKIHRPKEDSVNIAGDLKSESIPFSPFPNTICQKAPAKRKYLCQVCSKCFGWSTDLKRHMLTHTGERPFKCQMCDATFTRNFLLQKHESRVHSVDSADNRCTREDTRETIASAAIKNHTNAVEESLAVLNGSNKQGKVLKKNRLVDNNSNGSLALNLVKRCETRDKFAPPKRKQQHDESFDNFPQKVFNIF